MNKATLENLLRTEATAVITKALNEHYDLEEGKDILALSATEIAVPVLDAERNEKWIKVSISIPRGTRTGTGTYNPYDPYPKAQDYAVELADRQNKKDVREEQKAIEKEKRARKAAAKKTIKQLNTEGLDAMIHKDE